MKNTENQLQGLLIKFNGKNITTEIVTFSKEKKLEEFYDLLNCRTIDIVTDNKGNDIVVDDEGMLKSGNHVFQLNILEQPIAGNMLLFGKVDAEGNLTSYQFDENIEIEVIGVVK